MILDCCYSAGIYYDGKSESVFSEVIRSDTLPAPVVQNQNSGPFQERGVRFSLLHTIFRSLGRDMQSHVLLAACGPSEVALEIWHRGLFTTKLLDVLRERLFNTEPLTYISLTKEAGARMR